METNKKIIYQISKENFYKAINAYPANKLLVDEVNEIIFNNRKTIYSNKTRRQIVATHFLKIAEIRIFIKNNDIDASVFEFQI